MSERGRARPRSRSRGRGRWPRQAPGEPPGRETPQPVQPVEGEVMGQKTEASAAAAAGPMEITAGLQRMDIGEPARARRDVNDEGVNTRQDMEHVKESKSGTSGSPIELRCNYFRILSRQQWVLFQYHVDFNPSMESRRLRTALLFQHEQTLGPARLFDGGSLFLPIKLRNRETVLLSETRQGEKVRITVTLTNELLPSSPVCLQFYNIMFRRVLRILKMQQIGRNYYNPNDPLEIHQHRLTIWPGFTTAILQYESGAMLCVDVSHKVLRSETVLTFMRGLRQQHGDRYFMEACTKELQGLIVLTKYNNKTYRIDDIAWNQTPRNTFKKGDKDISFKEYYKRQYNLDIEDDNQVLLISHLKKRGPSGAPPPGPALLVPEFCFLTGLTDRMRQDFGIMRDLSQQTRLNPQDRDARLTRFIGTINRTPEAQAELNTWGIRFDNQSTRIQARVLPPENLYQGRRMFQYRPIAADWSRESRGVALANAQPLEHWLLFHTSQNRNLADSLLHYLEVVCKPLGMMIRKPAMIPYEDRQDSLMRALRQNMGPGAQMVVVILPNNRKEKYDIIKKYLCIECATPSQCVVARTLSRPQALMTIATKIALQMNCKMGGSLWHVEIPLDFLMVVGIDVYHDTAAGKRSIGALVASLNKEMTQWYSKCVLQHRGQEIMDGLKGALQGALQTWTQRNQKPPARIIVYRDGVGDGMLQSVVKYEIKQILDCIRSTFGGFMPKLAVVVVKKRISSRFFALMDRSLGNPPPGTVIDKDVTRPEWYDFFIISQAVRMGTVTPTHYNVVYDSSGLKPDHMQRLTYKLCHMYYNWQGIIRVPAPCQYAHKLAFLVGQSLHKEPDPTLDDLLYYL